MRFFFEENSKFIRKFIRRFINFLIKNRFIKNKKNRALPVINYYGNFFLTLSIFSLAYFLDWIELLLIFLNFGQITNIRKQDTNKEFFVITGIVTFILSLIMFHFQFEETNKLVFQKLDNEIVYQSEDTRNQSCDDPFYIE